MTLLKKLSVATAVTACLLIPAAAFARGGHGGHGGGGGGFKSASFQGGSWKGGGRHHGGHFWRGRWWGYGVGSCWRWTPAGYIWVCGY